MEILLDENKRNIIRKICDEYKLALHGEHGVNHWLRVLRNGLEIASRTEGVDEEVLFWFAFFHDSKRECENTDIEHGPRASKFVWEEREKLGLSESQLGKLMKACEIHSHPVKSSDPTIACCIDADKLDLRRVRITPDSKYMSLKESCEADLMASSNKRANEWFWDSALEEQIGIDLTKIIRDRKLRKYIN